MKKGIAVLIVLAGLGAVAGAFLLQGIGDGEAPTSYTVPEQIERFSTEKSGTAYTNVAFTDMEGRDVGVSGLAGRVVVLNLWATWCTPCVAEMPALEGLQRRLGGPDFQVAAVSVDRQGLEKVEPFLAEHGLKDLPIYLDPEGKSLQVLGAKGLPTTVVLDPQGREIGRVLGPLEWDSDPVVQYFSDLIAAQRTGDG